MAGSTPARGSNEPIPFGTPPGPRPLCGQSRRDGRPRAADGDRPAGGDRPDGLALRAGRRIARTGAATAKLRRFPLVRHRRSEEHTSELHSLMRISYAVFCLKKKKTQKYKKPT